MLSWSTSSFILTDMAKFGVLVILFATSCSADVYKLHGQLDDGYAVDIDIGTSPQRFSVIVDTGSANLAVASCNNVNISRFYKPEAQRNICDNPHPQDSFKVSYTVGHWSGKLVKEVVNLAGGKMEATQVNVALIYDSQSFFINNSGWEGILGLGYKALALPSTSTEPFFDSLSRVHLMAGNPNNTFALQLCGPQADMTMTGNLSIAEVDHNQFTGKLFNVAVVSTNYYQVVMTDMKVNNRSLDLECTEYNKPRTIVDSGTTKLLLPSVVYHKTISFIRGFVSNEPLASDISDDFWFHGGVVCSNLSLIEVFPVLTIDLMAEDYQSVVSLSLPPAIYIRPQKTQPNCYKLGINQSSAGTVLGAVVMEGFYIIFNRYKSPLLQFGVSSCLHRNWSSSISNYHLIALPPLDCYQRQNVKKSGLPTYAVVLLSIFIILIIFIVMYTIYRVVKLWKRRHHRLITNIDFQDLMHDTFDDPHL